MDEPLTREDLEPLGCDAPNCGHDHSVLSLFPTCHSKAGLCVAYDKREGALRISCGRCDKPVALIAVGVRRLQ